MYKRQVYSHEGRIYDRAAYEPEARELSAAEVAALEAVSYTHLRAHETVLDPVCRLLLEKKKKTYYC